MRRFAAKTLHISGERPVISFSFDDVPDSALYNGATILEKYGLRGTFYIAGQLTGISEPGRKLISEAGIAELAERGHEIGCHTYSHPNIATLNGAQLQNEIDQNHSFLSRILGKHWGAAGSQLNFAYPYNAVSYFAYRRMAKNYRSCRAGENRINRGATCLQMLFGMEIGRPDEDVVQLKAEIDAVKAQPGWLIFFTHDISETPTPYGCTPAAFEKLVQYAVQSGCEILTVNEALDRYISADAA
ncbi:polysaccharide deacetylase family protein [Bacillus subtilis]|uniref:polysaccharide deacetylase family protein n=1 Tax=Pseudochrobactrum asaccharolyticum TaxID=354351 RepID=UPI001F326D54|nr:polysaccharide deacetylase family protein [Pseudochrobactrum asaccharolyticum]MCF7644018.1 polysaccharide deacetylase family protein [Pseudochrobactrum asaccharolyticum]MCF7670746.1 polysaccharide deacetylase family protein [Bacillus subtilis]